MLNALPALLNMFTDKNSKIREALSWVFHRICEHHPDFVSNKQVADEFIPRLKQGLQDKPRISN